MESITIEFHRFGDQTGILRQSDRYLRTLGLTTETMQVSAPLNQEALERAMGALDYERFSASKSAADVEKIRESAEDVIGQLHAKLSDFLPTDPPAGFGRGELFQIDVVVHARELAQLPFEALERLAEDAIITRRIRQPWTAPRALDVGSSGPRGRIKEPRVLFAWADGGGSVPADRHRQLLDEVLADWGGVAGSACVELGNVTLGQLEAAFAGEHGFTHVHLLAHGVAPAQPDPGARIDLDAPPEPQVFIALEDDAGGLVRCSPEQLGAAFAQGTQLPGTVTLACCHSATVKASYSGGTFAHVLHGVGVPVVVASQLALTKAGSDKLIEVFLAEVLRGEDPRVALGRTRTALHNAAATTFYDGTAVVGYIHLNQGFERNEAERKFMFELSRLDRASKIAEAVARDVLAGKPSHDADELRNRFRSVRERLAEYDGAERHLTKKQREELRGLLASSHKREAQAAWSLSRVTAGGEQAEWLAASRSALREARAAYERATTTSLDHHWVWVQWLALQAVVDGDVDQYTADWIIAERAATLALGDDPIWARGSLVELSLLATAMPSIASADPGEAARGHLDAMTDLCVDADDGFAFEAMRKQLDRYVHWWSRDDTLRITSATAVLAAELSDRMTRRWADAGMHDPRSIAPTEPEPGGDAPTAPTSVGSGETAPSVPGSAGAGGVTEPVATTGVAATAGTTAGTASSTLFRVEMLPANEGDALWIVYGHAGGPEHRVLIDCGRKTAYRAVAERLDAGGDPLDLFVLTHVDADHIAGAVPLLQDDRFGPSRVRDVWFNGWRNLHGLHHDPDRSGGDGPGVMGARQGEYFAALLRDRGYAWNDAFAGMPVAIPDSGPLPTVTLRGGMELTILGPTTAKMDEMAKRWRADLDDLPDGKKMEPGDWERALELLGDDAAYRPDTLRAHPPEGPIVMGDLLAIDFDPDESEPNGSSIAFLAEFEGTSVLFAGDAHAPALGAAIRRLLAERGLDRLPVDAYKLSHHGSARNNSEDLLALLDCTRFLVSTNGSRHYHPDRAALARVLAVQGPGVHFDFNYRSDYTTVWDDDALRDAHGYTTTYPGAGEAGLAVELAGPANSADDD